ncbi:thiamine biosynthesis lipoprotein [Alkalibacterium subtropicum]|uniref:FAD:protein FMN transferase n=1 Tax=Alkalibacterium subtropicum TaxID=753702 RepID=A0A1I1LF50_9LACT|nr:FAD:protein FMN transferase [Alkalibacterium subtropicum]SFC71734.1 thiamine biosynthesis lipoprotein [Alkalibacterium subtropicum]
MKKRSKLALALMSIPLTTMFLTACDEEDPRGLAETPIDRTEFLLGTVANIKVFNENEEEAMDLAFERVTELDEWFAMQKEDSEIAEVNRQAGIAPVEVSEEVFHVMERALYYAEESGGTFDPTIGAVTSLWNIGQEDAAVPEQEELDEVLDVVDYNLVELDEENQTIFLEEEGMKVDLGAIAKGYITDEAARVLVDEGVNTAIIDLGGDIVLVGNSTRGEDSPWRVGIQNPYGERGEILGMVNLADKAIVTSGIYERNIEEDGKSYHHLMNPETGFPFENNLSGISIIADNAMDADAIANIAFSKGVEDGLEYINGMDGVDVIYVTKDKEVYASDNIIDDVEITDDSFEIIE